MGPAGLEALARLRRATPVEIPVLVDAKRNDISNSAEGYAAALFDYYDFDAATVNAYMGADTLEPFLRRPERGAFILCKTSNPGSGDLQDLLVWTEGDAAPKPLYETVARLAVRLNVQRNVGLVVGATYPSQLASIRAIASELPILIPGIGAQSG